MTLQNVKSQSIKVNKVKNLNIYKPYHTSPCWILSLPYGKVKVFEKTRARNHFLKIIIFKLEEHLKISNLDSEAQLQDKNCKNKAQK